MNAKPQNAPILHPRNHFAVIKFVKNVSFRLSIKESSMKTVQALIKINTVVTVDTVDTGVQLKLLLTETMSLDPGDTVKIIALTVILEIVCNLSHIGD